MAISLYDATVATHLQLLEALLRLIAKAQAWTQQQGLTETEIVYARLAEDMGDFAYQVKSAAWHSRGAVEGARAGSFSPDWSEPPQSFDTMIAHIEQAIDDLRALDRDEVEGWAGRSLQFTVPGSDFTLPFTVEAFFFSFSLPNFHFHVTTAYDILRWKGMEIGKLDYLGNLRTRKAAQ